MIERGDGVGIECTTGLLRAVRLDHARPGVAAAAAEVGLPDLDDDRAALDAFARLRAELGGVSLPTRIAMFPVGSAMWRIDVTGRDGPELNRLRSELEDDHGAVSSVLLDDGPRRWLLVLHWQALRFRRIEELAERAGFVDVAIDPSPVALSRVVTAATSFADRSAGANDAWAVALERGVPVAAASMPAVGRPHPELIVGTTRISAGLFEGLVDAVDIVQRLSSIRADVDTVGGPVELTLATIPYPTFPPHDLRAPERQCVALGAAVGAAGLAGRLRPVDLVTAGLVSPPHVRRPWAVELVSNVAEPAPVETPGPVRRWSARFRRRRSA